MQLSLRTNKARTRHWIIARTRHTQTRSETEAAKPAPMKPIDEIIAICVPVANGSLVLNGTNIVHIRIKDIYRCLKFLLAKNKTVEALDSPDAP